MTPNLEPVMTYQQIADHLGVCQSRAMHIVQGAIKSARREFELRGIQADWLTDKPEDRGYE